jgi:adenylylsulfate kinase
LIDSPKRSITKAASWRLFALVFLSLISFLITGDEKKAAVITILYHSIQVGFYFIHERMWTRVEWGKTTGLCIQMTGLSGSGKSTLARMTGKRLRDRGYRVEIIDGDEYREGLCRDLGFSKEDRNTNIRRLGFVSKILARNNVISIISAINPYEEIRKEIEDNGKNVKTVYVECDLETLKCRDTKGLYKRALLESGNPDKIYNFTGISDPFESPKSPDLVISTDQMTVKTATDILEKYIIQNVV